MHNDDSDSVGDEQWCRVAKNHYERERERENRSTTNPIERPNGLADPISLHLNAFLLHLHTATTTVGGCV
jgi:hypothetical protein